MKKFFLQYRYCLLLIIPLFIFIYSIWDHNFYIGGDVMVPLNPASNIQKIFLWDNGLESFQYAGFFWLAFYYFFSLIGFPAFVTQKVLLVLLPIIGFIFTYLLHKELFKDTKYDDKKLAFLSATIFTFNPIYFLVAGAGLSLYGFPVCFYFLLNFLKKNKIIYAISFSFLLNFFFFADLPQPKLLIVFFIASFFLILVYFKTRKFVLKDFPQRAVIIFLLGFLLNAWVFIPLLRSLFLGAGASFVKGLGIFGGDADFKIATLTHITRFFNYNIIKYYPQLGHFLTSPVFIVWTYAQWIILVLGFFLATKDKKSSKIIYTLVLSTLLFIFIAKGANPPLGQFYKAMVVHFPLAKIFRTTSSVITGAVIFYAFSLSIAAYYLSRGKTAIVYFIIIFSVALFYPLYFGYKFYNQLNYAPNRKGYTIPDQYYEMGEWLDNIKEDSKILSVPLITGYVSKKWYYFGPDILSWITTKPLNPLFYREGFFGIGRTDDKGIQVIPKNRGIFSLNNIRYLLFQKDSVGVGDARTLAEGLNFGDLLIRNSYFDLYKIKNEYFLPHFYIPRNIIYLNGNVENLADIVGFGDYDIRSAIHLAGKRAEIKKLGNLSREDGTEIVDRADEVLVNGELKDKIGEEELGTIQPILDLPYVRQRPGSLLYSLVLKQEEFEKWRVRNEPEKLFEKYLFYASKRIAELEKYGERYRDIEIERYRGEIKGAIEEIEKLRNSVASLPEIKKSETTEIWVKMLGELEGTLAGQRAKIGEIGRLGNWEIAFGELEKKVEELKIKRVFSRLVYQIDVPKEGNYEIFVRNLPAAEIGKLGVAEWISLEERYFKKGAQELALPFSGISENLVGENLQIKDYQPDSIYQISFDYLAPKGGGFFVAEGKTGEVAETDLPATGDKLGHFEMFFKSSSEAEEGAVHLSISVAEEKNLVVRRIYHPEIILRNIEPEKFRNLEIKKLPKITFVKINPTKYRIKVEEAKEPYTLVFSESYHDGWKAYVNQNQKSKIKNQNDYGETVASYFEGEIKEGTHKNSFLDKNTFEAWGKKPLAEEKHLLVNGYANSWHIEPGDAGGEESYEIIIEFAPQRLFYIGLGVSLATLLGCLGYLGIEEIRKFGRKAAEIKKLGN